MDKSKSIDCAAEKEYISRDNTVLDRWLIKRYLSKRRSRVRSVFKKLQGNFITKLLEYELIGGMTTGSFQKRIGKALNENPLEYTRYSILFGMLVTVSKYFYAYIINGVFIIGAAGPGFVWWGHLMLASNIYRFAHIKVFKKPISAVYIWPLSLFFRVKKRLSAFSYKG